MAKLVDGSVISFTVFWSYVKILDKLHFDLIIMPAKES